MSLICFVFTGSPTRSGTIWVLDGITGSLASANDCLSIAAEACCASRSTADDLRWRTLASAPATNTGEWDVVRSAEHTSELPSIMRISYAVFCLNKSPHTSTQHL